MKFVRPGCSTKSGIFRHPRAGSLRARQAAEGLSIIDEAFAQSGDGEEHWYRPSFTSGGRSTALVDRAPCRGNFAPTRASPGGGNPYTRSDEARELLAQIYGRFTE